MGILNPDNLVSRIINRIGDLIFLNVLWIICSIPIITIGASTTSLYYCCLKILKGDESKVSKNFFHAFKQNFRQSTCIWIILLLSGCILCGNIWYFNQMDGLLGKIVFYIAIIITILWFLITLYIFPVIATFENTWKNLVSNALIFAFTNFPTTIITAIITIFPLAWTLFDLKLLPLYFFLWVFLLIALIAMANSYFFYKIFQKHLT